MLAHGNKQVREGAEASLQKLGAPASAIIESHSTHKKKSVREACLRLMAEPEPTMLPLPIAAISEGRACPQAVALYALGGSFKDGTYQEGQAFEKLLIPPIDCQTPCLSEQENIEVAWASVATFTLWPASGSKFSTNGILRLLARLPNMASPLRWALSADKHAHKGALFKLLADSEEASEIVPGVWLTGLWSSSKVARTLAVQQLKRVDSNLSAQLLPLLSERKKTIRIAAAELLNTHRPADPAPLRQALDKEKVLEVATHLEGALEMFGEPSGAETPQEALTSEQSSLRAESDLLQVLAATRKKRRPKWLGGELPTIKLRDGTPIEGKALDGLLSRLSLEGPEHHDALLAAAEFDGEAFSLAIVDAWQKAGKGRSRNFASGPSAHKWAAYQQAIFVGDVHIDKVGHATARFGSENHHLAGWNMQWINRCPGAAADEAIALVAVLGGEGKVNADAKAQLLARAEAQGRGATEIIADCAFAQPVLTSDYQYPTGEMSPSGMVLDYGPRKFWGRFDHQGTLQPYDVEGKELKALPNPGKNDDAAKAKKARADFSTYRNHFKKLSTIERHRLESMMGSRERFSAELMVRSFHDDALLAAIGRGLIFRSSTGTLLRPEHGEWLTVDLDTVALGEGETFGLPHRLEFTDAERSAWNEHLADAELLQAFDQLNRPIFGLDDKPSEIKDINRQAFAAMLVSYGYAECGPQEHATSEEALKRFLSRGGQVRIRHTGIGPYLSEPVDVYEVCWEDLLGRLSDRPDRVAWSEACFDMQRMGAAKR